MKNVKLIFFNKIVKIRNTKIITIKNYFDFTFIYFFFLLLLYWLIYNLILKCILQTVLY